MKSGIGSELVFVYGTLRRGGSNAFRMDGAELVGKGRVEGKLYAISWYPGLVLGRNCGWVIGEVYRVSAEQLRELDEFEGISANEIEGAEYRRVGVYVTLDGMPYDDTIHCGTFEWKGPVAEERQILSGDWLEIVRPQTRPVFTATCLVFALCCFPSLGGVIWMPNGFAAILLIFGVPGCGMISGWVAQRRNERWPRLRAVVAGVCFVWLIVVSFFLAALFACWMGTVANGTELSRFWPEAER